MPFEMFFNRWPINFDTTVNQLKQSIVTEWGKLPQHLVRAIGQWRCILGCIMHRPAARPTH